jgi:hypothetical protein
MHAVVEIPPEYVEGGILGILVGRSVLDRVHDLAVDGLDARLWDFTANGRRPERKPGAGGEVRKRAPAP